MQFAYAPSMADTFPALVTGPIVVAGVRADIDVGARAGALEAEAARRLEGAPEGELPEIRAWRAAYARMGFKPTRVRSAAEALLRRLRLHGSLPRLHPLVDLCNAASAAAALPVAAFDLARIDGNLLVGPADGDERYLTFGGEIESPEPGEIVFRDGRGDVHARRWVNRQSGLSAVSGSTADALIVIEGLHDGAARDVAALRDRLSADVATAWSASVRVGLLLGAAGAFDAGVDVRA